MNYSNNNRDDTHFFCWNHACVTNLEFNICIIINKLMLIEESISFAFQIKWVMKMEIETKRLGERNFSFFFLKGVKWIQTIDTVFCIEWLTRSLRSLLFYFFLLFQIVEAIICKNYFVWIIHIFIYVYKNF